MKDLLKIAYKCSPFIIVFVTINIYLKNNNKFFLKEKEYTHTIEKALNNDYNIVFLGDSHLEALNSLQLDSSVYNFSYGGDGIEEMYIKTRLLLEKENKPQTVFLQIEPQIFNSSISPNKSFLSSQVLHLGEEAVYGKNKLAYLVEQIPLFDDGFVEFVRDRYVYPLFKKKKKTSSPVGKVSRWEDLDKETRMERAQQVGSQDHKGVFSNKNSKYYFSKLVKILKENQVKLVGIRLPVESNYYLQCSDKDLHAVNTYIDSLNLDLILDYSLLFDSPQLFRDQDHINALGAKRVLEEIEKNGSLILSSP